MFTKLTDTSKAAIFTVLVLFPSVGARNPGMEELLAVIDETEGSGRSCSGPSSCPIHRSAWKENSANFA